MIRSIRNMSIFRRLFISFALVTIIPAIIAVSLGAFYINALNARSSAVKTSFDAQNAATDQQLSLIRMNALLQIRFAQVFALNGNALPENDTTMQASTNLAAYELSDLEITFGRKLQTYQQSYDIATSNNMADIHRILLSDNPDNPVINQQHDTLNLIITQQWNEYKTNLDKVVGLLPPPKERYTPNYTAAYSALFDANNTYLDLNNSWQTLVHDATIVGTMVTNISGPSFTRPLIGYTVAAFVLAVLVFVGIGYTVDLTITRPLSQLVSLTKRIARGETDARAQIKGRDEICAVASSMNNMLGRIVLLVQEAQDRHARLQSQIEKLVNEVSGLGAGDLTIQAEVTKDELGVLAASFNYMTKELGNLVVRVKTLANEVGAATTMSSERMNKLVGISTLQIQRIATAASKVSDMTTASRNVAERAQLLSDTAHNARNTAQSGHVAVQQTVEGIERISQNVYVTSEKVQALDQSSREIGDIVKVISGITSQTNRLALDASIQAAMAGENGHGFTAIATDIRHLAERSKEQTLMISQIVRTVLDDINSVAHSMEDTKRETVTGSRLIDEAGQALDSVFSVVEQQANEIAAINQVAIHQLESSKVVVQIMQTVSASTRQSNTTTHETSQLMEHVAQLVEQLHGSVHVFKVREGAMRRNTSEVRRLSTQKQFKRTELDTSLQTTIEVAAQPSRHDPAVIDSPGLDPLTTDPLAKTPETLVKSQEQTE